MECHLLRRSGVSQSIERKVQELKGARYDQTVCSAEQSVVGIDWDVRSDAHRDEEEDDDDEDDEELENVGDEFDDDRGEDVA